MKPVQETLWSAVKPRGMYAQKDLQDGIGDKSDCSWEARTVTAGQGPDPACYLLRWSDNHGPIDKDREWVGGRESCSRTLVVGVSPSSLARASADKDGRRQIHSAELAMPVKYRSTTFN